MSDLTTIDLEQLDAVNGGWIVPAVTWGVRGAVALGGAAAAALGWAGTRQGACTIGAVGSAGQNGPAYAAQQYADCINDPNFRFTPPVQQTPGAPTTTPPG